jgi:EpsI family protein
MSLYFTATLALTTFIVIQYFSINPVSLSTKKLTEIPLQIGPWHGIEANLDQETIATLKVDDWILRSYEHTSGAAVWLYIGYYVKNFKPHSPLVCFPGQGWKVSHRGSQLISLLDGESFLVHKLLVQKGLEQHLILYWNQSAERVFTELTPWQKRWSYVLEEYWSRLNAVLYRQISRSDKAFVRVSSPILHSLDDTLSHETAFIQTVFPLLVKHLSGSFPSLNMYPTTGQGGQCLSHESQVVLRNDLPLIMGPVAM